jgi:hypothetical protein
MMVLDVAWLTLGVLFDLGLVSAAYRLAKARLSEPEAYSSPESIPAGQGPM